MLIGSLWLIVDIPGFGVFIERTGRGRLGIIICAAGYRHVRHIAGPGYLGYHFRNISQRYQGRCILCCHRQPVDRLFYTGIYVPGSGRTFGHFRPFLSLFGNLFFWIFIYPCKSKGNQGTDVRRIWNKVTQETLILPLTYRAIKKMI